MGYVKFGIVCLVGFIAATIITKDPRFIIGIAASVADIVISIIKGIQEDWMFE